MCVCKSWGRSRWLRQALTGGVAVTFLCLGSVNTQPSPFLAPVSRMWNLIPLPQQTSASVVEVRVACALFYYHRSRTCFWTKRCDLIESHKLLLFFFSTWSPGQGGFLPSPKDKTVTVTSSLWDTHMTNYMHLQLTSWGIRGYRPRRWNGPSWRWPGQEIWPWKWGGLK